MNWQLSDATNGGMVAPDDHDEPTIGSIEDLSQVFVDTLRGISEQGKQATMEGLCSELSKRDDVRTLLDTAAAGKDGDGETAGDTMDNLSRAVEEKEEERRRIHERLMELEDLFEREKDFNKRITLTLVNLYDLPGDSEFMGLMNEYKQLVMENTELERRENLLGELKNHLLHDDVGKHIKSQPKEKTSLLSKLGGKARSTTIDKLRSASIDALNQLRTIFGDEFADELDTIEHRIMENDDIEYLLSQRSTLLDIIEKYSEKVQTEKQRITTFIREVGDRLVELEHGLDGTAAAAAKQHREDIEFSENLEKEISSVRDDIAESSDFDSLKSAVLGRIEHLREILHNRRNEYSARMQSAEEDRENLLSNFQNVIDNLKQQNEILEEQSRKDPHTGIFNRRVFDSLLASEFDRFVRYRQPFSLIFFDIDHFKNVNDTYGHIAGDRALKGIAASTGRMLRKTDVFARYGGEEFVVILPETALKQSCKVAKKLCRMIEKTEFDYEGARVPITVSVGVTEVRSDDDSPKEVLERADRLMYSAKEDGRNRVVSDLDA